MKEFNDPCTGFHRWIEQAIEIELNSIFRICDILQRQNILHKGQGKSSGWQVWRMVNAQGLQIGAVNFYVFKNGEISVHRAVCRQEVVDPYDAVGKVLPKLSDAGHLFKDIVCRAERFTAMSIASVIFKPLPAQRRIQDPIPPREDLCNINLFFPVQILEDFLYD